MMNPKQKGVVHVYGAKVTNNTDLTAEFYTGLTARAFKNRLFEHTTNFNKLKKRHKASLSDHVWDLKLQGDPYTVSDGSKSVSKCLNQAHLGYSLNCIFKKKLQKVIEFVQFVDVYKRFEPIYRVIH